jgi:hypothetical protein
VQDCIDKGFLVKAESEDQSTILPEHKEREEY